LEEIVAAPVEKAANTAVEIRYADHATPSTCKSWHYLRREVVVARSAGRWWTKSTNFFIGRGRRKKEAKNHEYARHGNRYEN
jgi:hypothetical protein